MTRLHPDEHGAVGAASDHANRLGVLSAALRGTSPAAVCAAAATVGLGVVEWAVGPGEAVDLDPAPGVAERLAPLAGEHGLEVCGLSVQDDAVLLGPADHFRRLAEMAATFGTTQVRVFAPPHRGGPVDAELADVKAAVVERLELMDEFGVSLLIEPSPGTVVPGPEWFMQVANGLDHSSLGAVYDPGSLIIEGHVAPALAIATLGAYLRHVHVKDVAPRQSGSAWSWTHVAVGDGLVPWADVTAELARARYGGRFVIDHLSGPPEVDQLRADVNAARRVLTDSHLLGRGEEDP